MHPLLFGFHKPHRNADDAPHNVRLPRIREAAHLAFRFRMGNRVQIAVEHLAPTANKVAAQLNEIDRPVVLILPFGRHNLTLILVDLYDRTGSDDGEHRSVRKAHESVNAVPQVQVLEQTNRHLAPNLAQFREKIRAVELELPVRFHRHHERIVRVRHSRVQLCLRWREHRLIAAEVAKVAAEGGKDAGPMDVVNRPERVLLTSARRVRSVFNVVEPAARNEIVRILFLLSQLPAALFDLPQAQPEALPYPLQANTYPFGLRACFHEPGLILLHRYCTSRNVYIS